MKEVQVRFAVYYRRSEYAAAAMALAEGRLDAAAFVSGTVNLDGVAGAFDRLLSTSSERKLLVLPNS